MSNQVSSQCGNLRNSRKSLLKAGASNRPIRFFGRKWFSQPGVSYGARSIPPGQDPYMQFRVLEPFEVNRSLASPGIFNGQTGFGIQFQSPVGTNILIKRGIIAPFQNELL